MSIDNRYLPQKRVEEIGEAGQKKLFSSRVLIVGCGALGSPVAMYLAGAGVGRIIIADFDNVDFSNLHRQVFYKEDEIGLPKYSVLKERMLSLNSNIQVEVIPSLVNRKILNKLEKDIDIIIDAADNPSTTYMLDSFCVKNGINFVTAGVSGWEAQIFSYFPGGTSYSDIFIKPDNENNIMPCSITGIMGPTAGFAASLMAAEAIKTLCDCELKKSRLINANLLSNGFQSFYC